MISIKRIIPSGEEEDMPTELIIHWKMLGKKFWKELKSTRIHCASDRLS